MRRFLTVLMLCLCVVLFAYFLPAAEAQNAPEDPEAVAASTGIPVEEFYNNFKETIKASGKHSVSIEDRARRNGSRISVDDSIEIMAFFTETGSGDLIDRFNYQFTFESDREKENGKVLLHDFFSTLSSFFGQNISQEKSDEIMETSLRNSSCTVNELLIYGSTKTKGNSTILTMKIYYTGSAYVGTPTTTYDQNAEDDFRYMIDVFKASGIIPNTNGSFYFHEDYEDEWAQINWYQWDSFTSAQNFAISTDITWKSASTTPNISSAGCGFVFRANDTNNHLYASLRMDGKVYLGGIRGGYSLNYGAHAFGTHSTKGSAQLILVVNNDTITVYVDGAYLCEQRNVAMLENGRLAFSIWSGTNKDYGTRCTFRNIYYYTW